MSVAETQLSTASLSLREVAAQDPDRAAVEIDGRQMSYAELNGQADRLAQRLVAELDDAEPRVALRAHGTIELAVGYLAIHRAGAVAVTVDPTAPTERLQAIVADVEPALMLSDVDTDPTLGLPMTVAHPLTFGAQMPPDPVDRGRGELVSIVYTSGSTGVPKGIMLGREQMESLLAHLPDYGGVSDSRVGGLLAGTVSFIEQLIICTLHLRATLVAYRDTPPRAHGSR